MHEKTIARLERIASRGTLEVEHLLQAANHPSLQLAEALDKLAIEMGWSANAQFPEIPFGTWAKTISLYCREGYSGLIEAASNPEAIGYVLGVLEALQPVESLSAIVRIAERNRGWLLTRPEQFLLVADALNDVGRACSSIIMNDRERLAGRDFLHDVFRRATTAIERGTILCALRYFGDQTTLPLIAACPPMPPEWEPTRTAATRAIKKALKQQGASN